MMVLKLDRLGRNMLHILATVSDHRPSGDAGVHADGIDSSTPAGRMMIGVLGSHTEYERELTKERTALKRESSWANGTKLGRPRKVADADTSRLLSGCEDRRASPGNREPSTSVSVERNTVPDTWPRTSRPRPCIAALLCVATLGSSCQTDDASARCSAQLFDSSGHHRGVVVQHVR